MLDVRSWSTPSVKQIKHRPPEIPNHTLQNQEGMLSNLKRIPPNIDNFKKHDNIMFLSADFHQITTSEIVTNNYTTCPWKFDFHLICKWALRFPGRIVTPACWKCKHSPVICWEKFGIPGAKPLHALRCMAESKTHEWLWRFTPIANSGSCAGSALCLTEYGELKETINLLDNLITRKNHNDIILKKYMNTPKTDQIRVEEILCTHSKPWPRK